MLQINICLGNDAKKASDISYKLNSSLVGSDCFINNDVVIPTPYYHEGSYIQEIIIGDNNDNDTIIKLDNIEQLIKDNK